MTALMGSHLVLEPISSQHRDRLFEAAHDERIWEFNIISGFGPAFEAWFESALHTPNRKSFAIFYNGRIVGSSSFIDLSPLHRRTEIGHTWLHPSAWRSVVNVEAKRLMLEDAFERRKLNRVSFNVDALNQRSRKAVEKLGAVQEGILRRHAITSTGRIRDTVVYSILAEEWPQVRERLEKRIPSLT